LRKVDLALELQVLSFYRQRTALDASEVAEAAGRAANGRRPVKQPSGATKKPAARGGKSSGSGKASSRGRSTRTGAGTS
jgi:hypothetical protein